MSTTRKQHIIANRPLSIIARPLSITNPEGTKRRRTTQSWRMVTTCMLLSVTSTHLRCMWKSTIDNDETQRGSVAKLLAFYLKRSNDPFFILPTWRAFQAG